MRNFSARVTATSVYLIFDRITASDALDALNCAFENTSRLAPDPSFSGSFVGLTPSEERVIADFLAWHYFDQKGYAHLTSEDNPVFVYHNLNTGVSLMFVVGEQVISPVEMYGSNLKGLVP